jgi:hypothetical protein
VGQEALTQLFFGVGSGRVASMSLANALNTEPDCLCLHEGKVRDHEEYGEQFLPFLTLQNRRAYEYPEEAGDIFRQTRLRMADLADQKNLKFLGDVAYNYAPFVGAISATFPDSKLIFQFRDCLGFLSSCTATVGTDETPVGWPPPDKPLSKVESFISMGRWQPRQLSPERVDWESWSYVSKNIWLWAETNRVLLDSLASVPTTLIYYAKFEAFRTDPLGEYALIRRFLNLPGTISDEGSRRLTARPINYRKNANRQISYHQLTEAEKRVWATFAAPVRTRLGYDGMM